ncbi:MAG: hypothetical protein JJU11_11390 [Candidatus Sumerlaeia bacterium]|nr:hypothetical protein [Candidatus Sumerlaeia bacterium]
MTLKELDDPTEIEKFFKAFQALVSHLPTGSQESFWGFWETPRIDPSSGMWVLHSKNYRESQSKKYKHLPADQRPRTYYWQALFGIGTPSIDNIAVEMNTNVEPPSRRTGIYLKDSGGNFFLGHTGDLEGGETMLGSRWDKEIVEIEKTSGKRIGVVLLGALSDPNLLHRIREYVMDAALKKQKTMLSMGPIPQRTIQWT